MRIPLCREEIVTVEHTSTNEAWQHRQSDQLEQQFPGTATHYEPPNTAHSVPKG